uniref:Innexin n=1 Tax=Panagrolaimus sp. JU765 TaxID=591449 RepID=A0AC34QBQ3_9BILA
MALTTALSMLHYVASNEDRNLVDRMHSYFTTNLLIGLAVLVSFKQFGGKPLECLVPDLFSGAWEQYAEQYCFAQDTYYIPMKSTVADVDPTERREKRISYYQWVPFFLLISAGCFRLPSLLWKHFSDYSGIRIQQIIKLASDANNIKPDIKAANIRSLCVHLQGALRFHRRLQKRHIKPHRFLRMFNIQYSAYYVSLLYLVTKFCYLVNVAIQLYLMNRFLGTAKHAFYGFGAIIDLINGTTWEQSGMFPRVSLCDFEVRVMGNVQDYTIQCVLVRVMGNVQDYTIQCVLVINIFNEKIFIFLWFWYILLTIFTLGSFCYWFIVAFCPCYNTGYIAKHLEMSEEPFNADDRECQREVKQFVKSYLKADGMFAIRMLSTYSGVIFGTDLVRALWTSFHGIEESRRRCKSETDLTKVGVQESVNKFEDWRLRKESMTHSLEGYENRKLLPPPSPPAELMRVLMDKGTDTSESTPVHGVGQNNPTTFYLANNFDERAHPQQRYAQKPSAPSERPGSDLSRPRSRSPPISPPPQLTRRTGAGSGASSIL